MQMQERKTVDRQLAVALREWTDALSSNRKTGVLKLAMHFQRGKPDSPKIRFEDSNQRRVK